MNPVGLRMTPGLVQTRFKGGNDDPNDSSGKWFKGGKGTGDDSLPGFHFEEISEEGGAGDSSDKWSLGNLGPADSSDKWSLGNLGPGDSSDKWAKGGKGDSDFRWQIPLNNPPYGPSDAAADFPGLDIPEADSTSIVSALIGLGPQPGDIVFDTEKRHVYTFTPSTGTSRSYISSRNEEVEGGYDSPQRYGPESSMTYFLDQKSADMVQALLTLAATNNGPVAATAKQALKERLYATLQRTHERNVLGNTGFSVPVGTGDTLNLRNRPRVGMIPLEVIGEGDNAEIRLGDRITDIYGTLQPKK